MGGYRIDAEGLEVKFGKKQVLNGISVSILPGECVGILGASGCGKSTLLRVLSGKLQPGNGAVLVNENEPACNPRGSIGFVPQDDIVHLGLTVEAALRYSAMLRLGSKEDGYKAADKVIGLLGLEEHRRTRVGRLSGGQRRRVSIGAELLGEPQVLFLDEPTSGLDPALENQVMHFCADLAADGRTIVLTTHIMQSLACLSLTLVLSGGRMVWYGPPDEMLSWFGVSCPGDIYMIIDQDAGELARRFAGSPYYYRYVSKRLEEL